MARVTFCDICGHKFKPELFGKDKTSQIQMQGNEDYSTYDICAACTKALDNFIARMQFSQKEA